MQTLLEHIPSVIWENLLLMAILFLVYTLFDSIANWSPSIKYNIATTFQFIAAIHFICLIAHPTYKSFNNISLIEIGKLNISWLLPYMGIFYFSVLFVYLFQFANQCFHLRSLKKSADFGDQSKWIDLLKISGLKIPSKLKIGFSQQINTPIVFGILEPIILFPVSICTYLSPSQIKMILLHEVAHIKRFDFIIHLALKVINCILWFNPFVHALQRKIQLEREIACDTLVEKTFNDPLNYSKALFLLSQKVHINQINLSLGAYTNQSELLTRIQYLNKIPSRNKLDFSLLILIPFFVLINSLFFKISKENTIVSKPSISISASTSKNIKSKPEKLTAHKNEHKKIVNKVSQNKAYNDQWVTNKNLETANSNEILHYNDLLNETKNWVRSLESPVKYVGFDENALKQDSIENAYIERILMSTIIKSYQLKKTLLEQKLEKASNVNEASDYLMNSKEWTEIQQYHQWVREYLNKQ